MTDKTNVTESFLSPVPIKLSKAEAALLNKTQVQRQALDQFVQTIMQQGESRLAELVQSQKDAWEAIGKAHDIDFKKVDYALEGDTLVPVQIKLR